MIVTIKPLSIALWGPVAIHGYGIAILLGVLTVYYALLRDTQCNKLLSKDQLNAFISRSIIVGFLGGRILHVISEGQLSSLGAFCAPWTGGFSILGTVMSIALYLFYSTYNQNIPLMALLERVALYAPLAHVFGRLGCWWAGCCFGLGTTTHALLSVIYKGTTAGAPVACTLIPIQLYSALWYLALFFILRMIASRTYESYYSQKLIVGLYLIGVGGERLVLDFWRGDRIMITNTGSLASFLSIHQWISLLICSLGIVILLNNTAQKHAYFSKRS